MVKRVAPEIGAHWYDTSSWYRSLTLAAVRAELDLEAEEAAEQLMALFRELDLEVEGERVILQGEDVSQAIHGQEVNLRVARVAGFGPVRSMVAGHQRQVFGSRRPLILIGRSPLEPYPDPQLVVQLHKDLHEAAQHRAQQVLGSTHEDLARRNEHDSANMVRLGLHSDGVSFDATGLDIYAQASRFLEILEAEGFARL